MLRRAACVLLAAAAALFSGCVERRFRVETTPPGAYVTVNNKPVGPAPVDVPFLYYGYYDILIEKEGFQTKHIREHVTAPLYAYPPFDLITENFLPLEIQDFRVFTYDLECAIQPNLDQLKAEGEEYRQRAANLPPPRYPEPPPKKNPPMPPPPAALPTPRQTPPSTFPNIPGGS